MTAEFSCPVSRATLVKEPVARELEASPAECRALAERFGLAEVGLLRASVALERLEQDDLIRLTGDLEAQFAEICVVTLKPIPRRLRVPFELLYSLKPSQETPDGEVFVDAEGEDPPEPIGAEGLDLAEIVVQILSLHLEPYPRAPEADLDRTTWGDGGEDPPEPEGPFAALRGWRQ